MAAKSAQQLWRWFQTTADQYGKWNCLPELDLQQIREEAFHISALAVDVPDTPGASTADYSKAKYRGDFVIDIDHKNEDGTGNIAASIESAHKLAKWLEQFVSLEWLELYASGGKGFHIIIPWDLLWGSSKARARLPDTYKALRRRISVESGVEGLDAQIHAQGRGHTIRVANKQRPDGKYKVPLTVAEFLSITPELYAEYVKAPRNVEFMRATTQVVGLAALATQAEQAAAPIPGQKTKEQAELSLLADGVHPACMEALMEGKRAEGMTFNSVAIQTVCYTTNRAVSDAVKKEIWDEVSRNYDNGSVMRDRLTDLSGKEKSMRLHGKFSCGGMISVLGTSEMCEGCPLKDAPKVKPGSAHIVEKPDGYYRVDARGNPQPIPIIDSVVEITAIYSDDKKGGDLTHDFLAADINLFRDGELVYKNLTVTHETFLSMSKFKEAMSRVRNSTVFGEDRDMPFLRHHIFRTIENEEAMIAAPTIGIKNLKFNNAFTGEAMEVMTWVEPGWAVNGLGVAGQATYVGDSEFVARMQNRLVPTEKDKEIEATLVHALKMNHGHIIGRIIGWVAACNLREHRRKGVVDFPVLALIGPGESGKNKTAQILASLAGADYITHAPPGVAAMTAWPRTQTFIVSTTVPRIFDEANFNIMDGPTRKQMTSLVKATYQLTNISRGTLAKKADIFNEAGADTNSFEPTSPIMLLSTAPVALNQELSTRVMEVDVGERDRTNREMTQHFMAVWNRQHKTKEHLFAVGWALINKALRLSEDDVWAKVEAEAAAAPPEFMDRTLTNHSWTMAGLQFFIDAMKEIGFEEAHAEAVRIRAETEAYVKGTSVATAIEKSRNELDRLLDDMGSLIDNSSVPEPGSITRGKHYFLGDAGKVYLDWPKVYAMYAADKIRMQVRGDMEFRNATQALRALKQQPYFLCDEPLPGEEEGHTYVVIDMQAVVKRGNDNAKRFLV